MSQHTEYREWSEIADAVKTLLYELEKSSMAPGQYWISVSPAGEVSIQSTFSGDNSYIPGDDRIQLLRRDIREHGIYGPFDFFPAEDGEYCVNPSRDWPVRWDGREPMEGDIRSEIDGLTCDGIACLLDQAERQYDEARERMGAESE